MKSILKIIPILAILILTTIQTTHAQIIAILEITPSNDRVELEISEFRHLTDELRTQARQILPKEYKILTRDNIIQLLPPDEEEANCIADGCVIEIGRAIGAEYVTQGSVGMFGEMLTLTVELYESMSGNLASSFVSESKDIMGLLNAVREKSPVLFAKLRPSEELRIESGELKVQTETLDVAQLLTLNSQLSTKKSFWIALSLDVLGAAAVGFGVYQHINSNKHHDDYKKAAPPIESFENLAQLEAFEKTRSKDLQKAKDADKLKNIGYAVGGALLSAGIVVHIWF